MSTYIPQAELVLPPLQWRMETAHGQGESPFSSQNRLRKVQKMGAGGQFVRHFIPESEMFNPGCFFTVTLYIGSSLG